MAATKKITLSERLQVIAELIPPGSRVADVGTDHGYLCVYLLQNKAPDIVLACDINQSPLEHARRSAQEYGVMEHMEFCLCDGLAGISPDRVNTIVIAGMGGETIASILSKAPWTKHGDHLLLLQPMTKIPDLRRWLSENGYRFSAERLVYERHSYFPIMAVRGGAALPLTDAQIYAGIALDRDPLLGASLDATIHQLQDAVSGLEKSSSKECAEKSAFYRDLIVQLQMRKGEWLSCQM